MGTGDGSYMAPMATAAAGGTSETVVGQAQAVTVGLVEPVNLYSKVDRSVKYGFLFIGFTFLAFLLFDIVGGARVAAAEYLLTGAALVLFFVLLLAFAEVIGFTAAYVLIEGCYLVRDDAPLRANEEVDRAGTRVVVGAGSAYDLTLSRELKHAQIVRASSSQTVVDTFVAQRLDVAAGVKQQLEADAKRFPGHRLLPGRFMAIRQAMGLPKGRGEAARAFLAAFVEDMKASGFVAQALARHGVAGASVAPPADAA